MMNQIGGGSPWLDALRRSGGRGFSPPQVSRGGPYQGGPSFGTPGFRPITPPGSSIQPGMSFADVFRLYGGGGQAPYMPTLGLPTTNGGVTSSTSYTAPNPGAAMTSNAGARPGTSIGMQGSRGIGPQQLAQLRQRHIQQNRIPAARNPVY